MPQPRALRGVIKWVVASYKRLQFAQHSVGAARVTGRDLPRAVLLVEMDPAPSLLDDLVLVCIDIPEVHLREAWCVSARCEERPDAVVHLAI